jgi:hypothetical protein
MGYQESYVTTEDPQKFDALIEQVRAKGLGYWDGALFLRPVEIIELKKPIDAGHRKFPAGMRFIYVVGDRTYQRTSEVFEAKSTGDVEVIFTELMPSKDIFDKQLGLAKHEPFPWLSEDPAPVELHEHFHSRDLH